VHAYASGGTARVPLPDGSVFFSAGLLDFVGFNGQYALNPGVGASGDITAFCAALAVDAGGTVTRYECVTIEPPGPGSSSRLVASQRESETFLPSRSAAKVVPADLWWPWVRGAHASSRGSHALLRRRALRPDGVVPEHERVREARVVREVLHAGQTVAVAVERRDPLAVEGLNPIDSIVISCQLSPVGHPPVAVPVAVAGRSPATATAATKMKRRRCTVRALPLARKIRRGVAIIPPRG
jgi:hypothetical protein